MKQALLIGFALLISLLLTAPLYAGNAQNTLLISSPFTQSVKEIETPKQLVKFLKKKFDFKEDSQLFGMFDYWQTPEEFWKRKSGDCEDYALFSAHVLKQLGYDAFVISIYGNDGFAHTVTLYEEDGRFNVVNEDRLYRYQSKTIEEALTRVHPGWAWAAIAEKRGARGFLVEQLMNPHYHKSQGIKAETFGITF